MFISSALAVLGLLFFTATNYTHGRELWVSDGTTAGTRMVLDLTPGEPSTTINNIFPVPGGVVFTTAGVGQSIYFSDGTKINTRELKSGLDGNVYGKAGNYVYFGDNVDPNGGLWYTDGTVQKTRSVPTNYFVNRHSMLFLPFGPSTLFINRPYEGGGVFLHNRELNRLRKLPISITSVDTDYDIARAVVLGNKLIYVLNTPAYGPELWVSDGTVAGTSLLKDIFKGSIGAFDGRWSQGPFAYRGKAYFVANDNAHGPELWVTDGTTIGTTLLKDIVPGFAGPQLILADQNRVAGIGNHILFTVNGYLWKTDGTPAQTKPLVLRDSLGQIVSSVWGQFTIKGPPTGFLFEGSKDTGGELYKGNIYTGLVSLVKDINKTAGCFQGRPFDGLFDFTFRNGIAYFAAVDKIVIESCPYRVQANNEFWASNGTLSGTVKIKEIFPGIGGYIGYTYRFVGSSPALITVGGAPSTLAKIQ